LIVLINKEMTNEIFIQIALCSAVVGWCWVDVLTPDRAIFDKVKAYYPLRLEKPLNCTMCFSGWLSIFISCIYYICNYKLCSISDILYIVLMPMFTMKLVQLLEN